MGSHIDRVLEGRRAAAPAAPPLAEGQIVPEEDDRKFYSLLRGDVLDHPFLELRFRDGLRLCFPYHDVSWLMFDPKAPELRIDFGTTLIVVKGRGLGGDLFAGLKQRRVAWLKESDSEMEDNDENEIFIEEITFEADTAEAEPA